MRYAGQPVEVGPDSSKTESLIIEPSGMSTTEIRVRLQELGAKGREYAERLREAAPVLEQGKGRPEDDKLLKSVPSPDALLGIHTQIRAAREQMHRATHQQERPDRSLQPLD